MNSTAVERTLDSNTLIIHEGIAVHFEWVLVILRVFFISLFCLFIINEGVTLLTQTIVAALIMFSDLFDGMISRKNRPSSEQYVFRIADAIVDKVGALVVLAFLASNGKIPAVMIVIFLLYYILLGIYPLIYMCQEGEKNIRNIQATFLSRSVAFFTGIYCLAANNITFSFFHTRMIALFFSLISIGSIISHIIKLRRIDRG